MRQSTGLDARPRPSLTVDRTDPGFTRSAQRAFARPGESLRTWLLHAYVFLLPVQVALGPDLRLAVSDLFIPAYLVVSGFDLRRVRGAWSVWYPALLMVVGLGLLVTLLTQGSLSSYALLQKGVGLVVLLLTMACVLDHLRTVEQVVTLLRVFVAGVVVNVVVSLLAFVVQQGDRSALPQFNYVGTRLSGLLVDPNAFGGLIACALMLHLFTSRTPYAVVPDAARVAVTGVLSLGLVLTFSRSAWIAAVFGIGAAIVVVGRRAVRVVAPLLVGIAVTVPALAVVYLPELTRLTSRQGQIDARFSLIDQAFSSFAESPVWGIGLGVFTQRHGEIVHNSALWFLAEMGIVGLFVFLGLVTSFALRMLGLLRSPAEGLAVLALAALAAHAAMLGLSVGIEALYQRHWWLVLAVGAALCGLEHARRTRPGVPVA